MGEPQHPTVSDLLRTRVASWVLLVAFSLDAFLVAPLVEMGAFPVWLAALATSVTFVAAAIALHGRRGAHGFVLGLVVLAVLAHWGPLVVNPLVAGARRSEFVRAAASLIVCGVFAFLFLRDVFSQGRLPSRLVSAVFAYLFMGAAWAGAYHCADVLRPGTLSVPGGSHGGATFIYFSFITLTSVGYGDIVPVGPLVRSMAVLEALAGQLYLVVVVSRFVGEGAIARAPAQASGARPPAPD